MEEFWIIHTVMFRYNYGEAQRRETGERYKLVQYQWPIPVYVYSINEVWDGSETFDICPVNYDNPQNSGKSWQWRLSHSYEDIGKSLFRTAEEAWKSWRSKYSETAKREYRELYELHRICERATLPEPELAGEHCAALEGGDDAS
jgi:hypothetical protein